MFLTRKMEMSQGPASVTQGHLVFHSGQFCEGATAALSSAELPEKRPYRTIQQAADDAPYFTQIE